MFSRPPYNNHFHIPMPGMTDADRQRLAHILTSLYADVANPHPHRRADAFMRAANDSHAIYASVLAQLRNGRPTSVRLGESWVPAGLVNFDFITNEVINAVTTNIYSQGAMSGTAKFIRDVGVVSAAHVVMGLYSPHTKHTAEQHAATEQALIVAFTGIVGDIVPSHIRLHRDGILRMAAAATAMLVWGYMTGNVVFEMTGPAEPDTAPDDVNERQHDSQPDVSKTADCETGIPSQFDRERDIQRDELYTSLMTRREQIINTARAVVEDVRNSGLFLPLAVDVAEYDVDAQLYEAMLAGKDVPENPLSPARHQMEVANRLFHLMGNIRFKWSASPDPSSFDVEPELSKLIPIPSPPKPCN